jgi:hypothetical protein
MARERLYRNNAEKQAAYRARHAHRELPSQRLLAHLGLELHGRLREAVEAGRNRVPATLLGKRPDDTLIHLMRYVSGLEPEAAAKQGGQNDASDTAPAAPDGTPAL